MTGPALTDLAVRSLRFRTPAFAVTFCALVAGSLMVGSFATLLETSLGPVPAADREILTIMGLVVGGWGTVIVLFSLVSTLSITVGQRAAEIALLRTVGATPRQVRRLVRLETFVVAVTASVVGAAAAWLVGRGLLAAFRSAGMVSESVTFGGSVVSLAGTVALMVVTALVAASFAARRSSSRPARTALVEATAEQPRMPRWRKLVGLGLVAYGLGMAVITITVTAHSDDPYAAMQTSGAAAIVAGVGLAALAPVLLRWAATAVRPLLDRLGAAGHLGAYNAARRAHLLGGILGPVIVFVSAGVGTLTLVGIDRRTIGAGVSGADAELITLLNNIVVGMIALFAATMVVNAMVALVARRHQELRRLRLLGATPRQVRGSVLAEAGLVAVVGTAFGTLAALASTLPFGIARDEGLLPDGQLWLAPLFAALALALTLGSAAVASRRAVPDGPVTMPERVG